MDFADDAGAQAILTNGHIAGKPLKMIWGDFFVHFALLGKGSGAAALDLHFLTFYCLYQLPLKIIARAALTPLFIVSNARDLEGFSLFHFDQHLFYRDDIHPFFLQDRD